MFLSTLRKDAAEALARVWKELPKDLASFIQKFDATAAEEVREHLRYEFRVALVPVAATNASTSTVSMTFVRAEELTAEGREALQQFVTIVRDRQVPVGGLGEYTAKDVARQVSAALGCRFSPTAHHARAWQYFNIRPRVGDAFPARTDVRYCTYYVPHKAYSYTQAWIDKLVKELSDPHRFAEVTGIQQVPL